MGRPRDNTTSGRCCAVEQPEGRSFIRDGIPALSADSAHTWNAIHMCSLGQPGAGPDYAWDNSARKGATVQQEQPASEVDTHDETVLQEDYGGIGRLAYFLGVCGVAVLCALINTAIGILDQGESLGLPHTYMLGQVLVLILVAARLQNTGASGWWSLITLVPLLGLVITIPCFVYPEGYKDTRKLDTAGRIIACVLLVPFIAILWYAWRSLSSESWSW